jgi:hypothetical protein
MFRYSSTLNNVTARRMMWNEPSMHGTWKLSAIRHPYFWVVAW